MEKWTNLLTFNDKSAILPLMTNGSNPLTQTALARLKKLAQGNLINPDQIKLIETVEKTYALHATIQLTPSVEVKTKQSVGRPKSKNHKLFSSFNELGKEIEKQRASLEQGGAWVQEALEELKKTEGHGWGHDGSTLFWDKEKTLFAAHEACPSCHGTGQSPCPTCQGVGTVHCYHCEGRQMEICPLCHGTGQDPAYPDRQCPQCLGEKQIFCRFCNATGRMPCEQCKGTGQLACPSCKGTGYFSRIAEVKKCASVIFSLGETTKIPSGLLRLLQRVGESNLHNHAQITMTPADEESAKIPKIIHLTAHIPYADVKVKLEQKACLVSVFGTKRRMAGVPHFLDVALEKPRTMLQAVARGHQYLGQALTARLMKEALSLVLQGKTHPNALRRLYPIGLSPDAAKEIMNNMDASIRNITRKTRVLAGGGFTALSAALFAGLFMTSFFAKLTAHWNPILTRSVLIVLPVLTTAACASLLLYVSKHVLQKRFKEKTVKASQPLGHVGYGYMALLGIIYLVVLYLGGILS